MPTGPTRHQQVQKIAIKIDEVSILNRAVHGYDKSNVLFVASFNRTPSGILQVPAQGERWIATRTGMGQWYLESRLDSTDQQTWAEANLVPGDVRIDGNNIWLNGSVYSPPPAFGFFFGTFNFVCDGRGSVLSTGIAGDLYVDAQCRLNSWTLLADTSGSIQMDVWASAYSGYPPTVLNSITGSNKPKLTSQLKNNSTTTGWLPTVVGPGTCLRFNIDSVSGIHRVTLALSYDENVTLL